jgi:hypothetical protein
MEEKQQQLFSEKNLLLFISNKNTSQITQQRKNKTQITIPFMNLLELNKGLIKNYQTFIDSTPLYTQA